MEPESKATFDAKQTHVYHVKEISTVSLKMKYSFLLLL